MSALNYGFLVQPTRMEGKNSYCVVKLACVAAGPRTRLNHLYTEGLDCLERLRRRLCKMCHKMCHKRTMQSLESIFFQSY